LQKDDGVCEGITRRQLAGEVAVRVRLKVSDIEAELAAHEHRSGGRARAEVEAIQRDGVAAGTVAISSIEA